MRIERPRHALLTAVLAAGCGGGDWRPPPAPPQAALPPPAAALGLASASAPSAHDHAAPPAAPAMDTTELRRRIAQFAPAKITADLGKLPAAEKAALDKLIEASRLLDPVFDRQAYAANPELAEALAKDTSELGRLRLDYFRMMRGPWDRQDHWRPFATDKPRPHGAGFYPEDLDEKALDAHLASHPGEAEALKSLFTLVRRDGDRLVAVPYRQAFRSWLEPAAERLREAAALTKNPTLRKFLRSRADAFLSDDYYQSDKDWMDLDSLVEVTIGPYEVYEDELKGLKASYESFVTVTDPDASRKLARYKSLLPEMEKHLPIPDEVKTTRGAESPIRVVDLVFSAGDARKSVQTIAFNLPNDERVRNEKGSKKVLLRNVIQTKFDRIMRPIAERILDPAQLGSLSSEAFFNQTLFHELAHGLGPAHTVKDGKKVEVRVALEAAYAPLEECKADVMGAYNILFMIEKGLFPKAFREELLVSYFAGLFRSVRFGVREAHGKGAAVQINRYLEEGAARFDGASGRFTVDLAKLEASIKSLVHDLCMLQHRGDEAAAQALLARYGVSSPAMQQALARTTDVPVDLRPSYPAAGEP
jgi:hypothetical protein